MGQRFDRLHCCFSMVIQPSDSRHIGLQADKDVLEHIVYDFNDTEMLEALRPSLEEAQPIQSQASPSSCKGPASVHRSGILVMLQSAAVLCTDTRCTHTAHTCSQVKPIGG